MTSAGKHFQEGRNADVVTVIIRSDQVAGIFSKVIEATWLCERLADSICEASDIKEIHEQAGFTFLDELRDWRRV